MRLPRWWNCELARLSIWLNDRWGTHHWVGSWAPGGPCDACHRRPSWLVIGGSWIDEPEIWDEGEEPEYLDVHPVEVCFWCKPDLGSADRDDRAGVELALREAGRQSVAWRWRSRRLE
jgi:hypothetical protein